MTRIVGARFPDLKAVIHDCYLRDPEFRRLCHDVGICVAEIDRLTSSAASGSTSQRLEQFRELKRELEVEIVEFLNSMLARNDGSPGEARPSNRYSP